MAYDTSDTMEYAMPDRVWCDPTAGISFRYPYEWICFDQNTGDLQRPNGPGPSMADRIHGTRFQIQNGTPQYDVRPFSYLLSQLPNGLAPTASLKDIGSAIVNSDDLTWENWDYYKISPRRPFAAKGTAPTGVVAQLGRSQKRCCLILKHGDRISGLRLLGSLEDEILNNLLPVESFEILNKYSGNPRSMTWREAQCRKNQVMDTNGKMVSAATTGKPKPVPWNQAWEMETEHYHITANRDPARLAFFGQYYEALWRCYAKLFQPTSMPPLKAEVHVFEYGREFEGAARIWVDPQFVYKRGSDVMGGFFSPNLLSLWVYEENASLVGPSGTVEHVSAHECTHQFVHFTCNGSAHVPTWINEGLAVYFENGVFRGGEFQLQLPAKRLELLKALYSQRKQTLRPLDSYLNYYGGINAANYGEVFAMTYFWVFSDSGTPKRTGVKNGQERFHEYWNALKAKEDGAEAFERIFMADMIQAQGSRDAAILLWSKKLIDYVNNGLKAK